MYLVGFALCAFVYTLPAPFFLEDHLLGKTGDNFRNVWTMWWMHTALEDGLDPYFTDRILHPDGTSLRLHNMSPLNTVPASFLLELWPPVAVFNTLQYIHMLASALAMAWLARVLGAGRAGSFIAGVAYTFNLFRAGHVGHLNIASTMFLPLAVGVAWRLRGDRPLRGALLCGVVLTLAGLASWYHLIIAAAAVAVTFAVRASHGDFATRVQHRGFRRAGIACVVALLVPMLLLAPLTVPMWQETAARPEGKRGHPAELLSADVLSYVVPGPLSSYGILSAPVWLRFRGHPLDATNWLGIIAVALALSGLLRSRDPPESGTGTDVHRRVRRLLLSLGAVGFVLSLGPQLRVAGHATGIPMPYAALAWLIPPLDAGGAVIRFSLLVTLAVVGLASFGVERWLPRRRALRAAVGGAIVWALLVEQSVFPFPMTAAHVSPIYSLIARDPRDVAVLDLATHGARRRPMLHQTVHGKPIVGGRITRSPAHIRRVTDMPVVRQLIVRTRTRSLAKAGVPPRRIHEEARLTPEQRASEAREPVLKGLGVAYVVTVNRYAERLCKELGYKRVVSDPPRTLFRVF